MPQQLFIEHFDPATATFSTIQNETLLNIVETDDSLSIDDWDGTNSIFYSMSGKRALLLWLDGESPTMNIKPVESNGSIYKIYEIADKLSCWVFGEEAVLYIPRHAPLFDPKNRKVIDLRIGDVVDWTKEGLSIPEIIEKARSKPSSTERYEPFDQSQFESNGRLERQKKIIRWVVIIGFLLAYILYEVFMSKR